MYELSYQAWLNIQDYKCRKQLQYEYNSERKLQQLLDSAKAIAILMPNREWE